MIPEQCDVVIIGAGPAGSLLGTYLSRMGYDVVIFDKQHHPRYHVGESLIPDFWRYCDEAGVSQKIMEEGFVTKAGGTVAWHDTTRQISFRDFGYTRPALHVERDRFDFILLDHAREQGARVFEEIAVYEVDFAQVDAVRVSYRSIEEKIPGRITCRFVVDASGQNAVIGKQLGLRVVDDAFRFMSVWGYFVGSRYIAADGNIYPAEQVQAIPPTTFVTSLPNMGSFAWAWHIMLRESTSVGLILPIDRVTTIRASGEPWEAYFLRQCRTLPGLGELVAGAQFCEGSVRIVHDYSYRSTRVAGPGYFLLGDAAGFVDPIFSIGVVLAMYSAHAAAWSIDRSFKNPGRTAEYQAIFSQQLQARLELSRALALPRYGPNADEVNAQAQEAVKFASSASKALMSAASTLTSRSANFEALSH